MKILLAIIYKIIFPFLSSNFVTWKFRTRFYKLVGAHIGSESLIGYRCDFSGDIRNLQIENDFWIGTDVVILPKENNPLGFVIATESVITQSTEPNGLCVGVPVVRKKDIRYE